MRPRIAVRILAAGWLFIVMTVVAALIDLASKAWVFHAMKVRIDPDLLQVMPHRPVEVIPGVFHLVCALNKGGMWGFFAGHTFALVIFSIVCIAVIAVMVVKLKPSQHLMRIALALILAGAIGNLWDRLTIGAVRDFLDFDLGIFHWPTFNVADIWIVLGVIIIFVVEFIFPLGRSRKGKEKKDK
jgi:signal peptidase II